jgi:hypothetical protein
MDGLGERDLPSIEDLTASEPVPDRIPGELTARVLHHMGEGDAPLPRRPVDAPDTADLRRELGL